MASISLPTLAIVAAAASVVSAGVAAYSSHEQGVAASNADKQKARAAAEDAAQKQINMRQKMLANLATQNAQAGVGGGAVNRAGALRQITQAQNDLLTVKAGGSAEVSLLDNAAAASRAAGDLGAATDVLGGISKGASLMPGSGGTSH